MKMRLPGKVLHDAGDLAEGLVLQFEGLTDDVGAVEISSGGRFVDDDGVWLVERRSGVARDHGYGKDLEEGRVGECQVVVPDPVAAFFYQDVIRGIDANHLLHLRAFFYEGEGQGLWRDRSRELGTVEIDIRVETVDAVGIYVKPVIAELVSDIEDDEEADTDTGGETDNVDGSETLGFPQVAEGDLEIVAEHGGAGFLL